ncbi:phenylacetic acid degradation protein [Corynebacterium phocae]|uniref:Phenylacetic acid degradation protein n=1 Tax=Corynebacterium phocae TaxID=161895 RepID=A0A1L7D5V8_9CORY|nr:hydroxyphenylacetyl-CoA thioesterase PaaI [Corynebacterium phocae]APT93528.1 phenylacetic acid degradation protein [Corynebacterium phocae]KAA8720610.1 hydroxyphenylacetyl-CoA thioesterase PaaI [Corynebacterium phocae]
MATNPTPTPDTTKILARGVGEEPELSHVRDMFLNDVATAFIGAEILELSAGYCRGQFTVRPEMCNGHGITHGGFIYTFADSVFAGACNSFGQTAVAVHNSIHYIAPTRAGDVVEATAKVSQRWGRNGIADVELTSNGHTIAEFRGTFRVVPKR